MDKFSFISIPDDLLVIILLIFGILIFATILFFGLGFIFTEKLRNELQLRTKSWWVIALIFVGATVFDPLISTIAFGLLSFFALRELFTMGRYWRDGERKALFWCFIAIPVQYYFAYMGYHVLFLTFIPIFMFIFIPFVLVLHGETEGIGHSMSVIPANLMFCVFGISHAAYMVNLAPLPGFEAGGKGLLLFLVFLTEMNDVFQFTWGKLFGKWKIVPKVSPNKTWEGFIGGFISTVIAGYFLRFLTPLSEVEAICVSAAIALTGFIGDVVISAVKRDVGVKDSGSSIPGHGGYLDRVDSLATTTPVFFHLVFILAYKA